MSGAVTASSNDVSIRMIDGVQLSSSVEQNSQPLASRVDSAAHSVPLLAEPTNENTLNISIVRTSTCKKKIKAALFSLPQVVGSTSMIGFAENDSKKTEDLYEQQYICCIQLPNEKCIPSCTDHAYDAWQTNLVNLDKSALIVAGVGIAGACLGVLNFKVLADDHSPNVLKVVSVADLVFGSGLIVIGTVVLPASFTLVNPITITTGACFISAGGYLAIKSCGGFRSLCTKITSCFQNCLEYCTLGLG